MDATRAIIIISLKMLMLNFGIQTHSTSATATADF